MSRHFMPEVLTLLEEQGYAARKKSDGGYQITSPLGRDPEYKSLCRSFSISDPQNSRDETVIRNRLRQRGVKFPEDTERSQPMVASYHKPPDQTPPQPSSPYASIRAKINSIMTLFGQVEQELNAIEASNAKLVQLRELLKGMG